MSSNISVDDLLNSMKNSGSTPVVPLDSGGVSIDSLLQNIGQSNKSPEVVNAGVGADYTELAGQGLLRGIEKVGAGVQELGRSAFKEVTGIDVLSDWKEQRIQSEKEISDYVGKMNAKEQAAFGGLYNVGETGSYIAALPATTAKAILSSSALLGASMSTSDGALLSQERTMNMLVAANSGLVPTALFNAGKFLVGKTITDPLTKVFDLFSTKGGSKKAVEGIKSPDVQDAVDAADRLGVRITPAEASANQVILTREAGAFGGLNPEKALVAQDIRLQRDTELAEVVGSFVKSIVPEGREAAKSTLGSLYKTAFDVRMSPKFVVKLRENAIFSAAEKRVMSDPAKAAKFKLLKEGSLGQVEMVRREISNSAHAATTSIDTLERQKAGALRSVNSLIKGALKNSSEEYALALPIAQRQIAQKRIMDDLAKVKTKASPEGTSIYNVTPDQFYDKILSTPQQRAELARQLKNVGGSSQAIDDLAFILARLKNTPFKALNAAEAARAAQSGSFGFGKLGVVAANTISYMKGRHNQAMLDIVTNGKWHKSLNKVKKIKDPTKQREALSTALAYISASNVAKASQGEDRTAAR
tara:strand:- start:43 stop:1803 length:1761 start_codon:yes stop_codon:yes gene_type:complete